jgi:hypothetical protein
MCPEKLREVTVCDNKGNILFIILSIYDVSNDPFSNSFYMYIYIYTGRFIMFSVITNNYNKKTKGPTLIEFFTSTGKLKKVFFSPPTRDVRCVHHG